MTGHSVRNASSVDILNWLLLSCLYIILVMEVLNYIPRALKKNCWKTQILTLIVCLFLKDWLPDFLVFNQSSSFN